MKVAIIDYGSGNLHSARKAFERAAGDAGIRASIMLTDSASDIAGADRIVLPGVGAFADCKAGLQQRDGLLDSLSEAVISKGRPFLGICVGMQLMATRGLEHQVTAGLGWIDGEVQAIKPNDAGLKIPHMGWNTFNEMRPHPLLSGIATGPEGLHAYFVHSYHLVTKNSSDIVAQADYGGPVTAIVGRDNLAGTQFHPEKSQKLGLALITNFLRWKP